jgi:hypothetical protein
MPIFGKPFNQTGGAIGFRRFVKTNLFERNDP